MMPANEVEVPNASLAVRTRGTPEAAAVPLGTPASASRGRDSVPTARLSAEAKRANFVRREKALLNRG